jgi:hypothetical protein
MELQNISDLIKLSENHTFKKRKRRRVIYDTDSDSDPEDFSVNKNNKYLKI